MVLAVLVVPYWLCAVATKNRPPIVMAKFYRYLVVDCDRSWASVRYSRVNAEMMSIPCRWHSLPLLHAYRRRPHCPYPTNCPPCCAYPTSPSSQIPFYVWRHWMANRMPDAVNTPNQLTYFPLYPTDLGAYAAQLSMQRLVCRQNTYRYHTVMLHWSLSRMIPPGGWNGKKRGGKNAKKNKQIEQMWKQFCQRSVLCTIAWPNGARICLQWNWWLITITTIFGLALILSFSLFVCLYKYWFSDWMKKSRRMIDDLWSQRNWIFHFIVTSV